MFSTTVTWNWRGRQITAVADKNVNVTQRAPKMSLDPRMASCETPSNISAAPSATKNVTNTPTAISAASLTMASSAIAATTPWWRSFASRFRVPNKIVNNAIPAATQNAVVTPSVSPAITA